MLLQKYDDSVTNELVRFIDIIDHEVPKAAPKYWMLTVRRKHKHNHKIPYQCTLEVYYLNANLRVIMSLTKLTQLGEMETAIITSGQSIGVASFNDRLDEHGYSGIKVRI